MKKILFVVDERKMGGVSTLLEDMLSMLNLKNKEIDILVLHDNGDKLESIPSNVNIIFGTRFFETVDIPFKQVLKTKNIFKICNKIRLVFMMKTGLIKKRIKKERKRILKKKYDIEIAFKDGFTAIFVSQGNSIKKFHWLQYDYKTVNPNSRYDKLFKKILKDFDKIIAVSKGVMDDFNEIYHLEEKTFVINNLINIDRIKNLAQCEQKQNENENENEKVNIISVGRLHSMKGYHRLINVINRLNKDNLLCNTYLNIYGDGPEMLNLQKQINDYKLNDVVKLKGKVNNPYIYMKKADLFVLSSLYEPFGLVIIESLTLGVPVVSTKNSATEELIQDGIDGIIVDNSDQGLYEGIKMLLKDNKKIKELKIGAKEFNYSEKNKKILKQLEEIFK